MSKKKSLVNFFDKGMECFQKNEFEKAIDYFRKALKITTKYRLKKEISAELNNNLGTALICLDRFKEAEKPLREAWRYCSKGTVLSIEIIKNFGLLNYYQGRKNKEKESLEKAIEYFKEREKEILKLEKKLEKEKTEEIKEDNFLALKHAEFSLACVYFEKENPIKAIEILKPWLKEKKEMDKDLQVEGISLLVGAACQKDNEEIIKEGYQKLKKVVNQKYLLAKIIARWAEIYFLKEDWKKAIEWLKEGLRRYLQEKEKVKEEVKEEVPFEEILTKIEELEKDEIIPIKKALSCLSFAFLNEKMEKDYSSAEKLLKMCLPVLSDEEKGINLMALGDCQIRIAEKEVTKEKYKEALENLRKAEEIDPSLGEEVKSLIEKAVQVLKKIEGEERIVKPGLEKEHIFTPEDIKIVIFRMETKNKELLKVGKILEKAFGQEKPAIVLEMIKEVLPKFRDKMIEIKKREFEIKEIIDLREELLEWIRKKTESEEVLSELSGTQVQEYLQEIEKKLS